MKTETRDSLEIGMYRDQIETLQHEVKRLNRLVVLNRTQHQDAWRDHMDKLRPVQMEIIEDIDKLEDTLAYETSDDLSTYPDEDRGIQEGRIDDVKYEIEQKRAELRRLDYDGSY